MSELKEYKCPNCGGPLQFDPGVQKIRCGSCGTEIDIEAAEAFADTLGNNSISFSHAAQTYDEQDDSVSVYVCQSCGGEIIQSDTDIAGSCPFCGNPIVNTGKVAGTLKPDLVIPFQLNKNQAIDALNKHIASKKLVPKVFKDRNHIDEIKGVYVPFWLFDADCSASVAYKGCRVRTYRSGQYRVTETDTYLLQRQGSISFKDVPVDGSKSIANELMESIEPFDTSTAVDFQTAYLAGYLANKYDEDDADCVDRANKRIRQSTENAFYSTTAGYSGVVPYSTHLNTQNGQARYALLPVWILHTSFAGKNYLFAMNGQTGKMVGDLPMDKGAFARMFIKTFLIITLILIAVCALSIFVLDAY